MQKQGTYKQKSKRIFAEINLFSYKPSRRAAAKPPTKEREDLKMLRKDWKAHGGNQWNYKENQMGFSVESVVQFTQRGRKRYEAHFRKTGCCGFANCPADLTGTNNFDNREEAFIFCEEMYKKREEKKNELQSV